ncbi:MAG TPA: helix-turn-helix transcriptional regulator [Caulobacteraceae bacterium]|nr:helix-turn-helix transcriptional regulator [Caulobacteraceae bacterium]
MADPIDQHIGERLADRRRALGLTLQQVAIKAGVSFQQIHKYETASSRMTPARLWSLANALGVDVSYFFDGFANTEPARDDRSDTAA